jgi:putative nucleotidyltransferase with HDIG domain
MSSGKRKLACLGFGISLAVIVVVFAIGLVKTATYNRQVHSVVYHGQDLFADGGSGDEPVSVKAGVRNSTWTKVFDFYDEGLTDHNYQAFTYDFYLSNNTKDEVEHFTFRLTFGKDVFLSSAWNGSLEVHQATADGELVSLIPDLREFVADDHNLTTVTFDGETLVHMKAGDYLIYHPSTSMNAMEMPIKPFEGTTPGFIMYLPIGENLEDCSIELEYTFHRLLSSEPLFWVAVLGMGLWTITLVVFFIISAQIKKYTEWHERDNEIINESIETFTGFIDAKDPYTNGHSKRVAKYTKMIAKEMGYDGEELDRIYYVALLHDCGKIGIPDSILGKPGRLTPEEFEIIKSHAAKGGEILHSFRSLDNVGEGAMYHHERYDGKGYPEGRAGHDIPLIARMICVADSFDAMNTDRVYRKKLSREAIIDEIMKNKGLQFDPAIADIMLRLIESGAIPTGD